MRRARDGNHVGKKEQLEIAYRRIRQMTHRVLQYGNIQFITSLEFKLTYSCRKSLIGDQKPTFESGRFKTTTRLKNYQEPLTLGLSRDKENQKFMVKNI